MKQKFRVEGMFCASCVAHVEKSVKKLDGIVKVNVSLLTNSMIVEYDQEKIDEELIISAVNKGGYKAFIDDGRIVSDKKVKNKFIKLVASLILMVILLYVSMGPMINLPLPYFKDNNIALGILEMVLVLPICILNGFFFIDGFKKLFKLAPNMSSLIAIASTASLIYSIYVFIMFIINPDMSHLHYYFESCGTILSLVSLGKYIEYKSKGKTTKAIEELIRLVPEKAIRLIKNEDGVYKEEEIYLEEIEIGDILLIKSGKSIPVDGEIIEGSSEINESLITGESIPVFKSVGDNVISSTISTVGSFKMRATTTAYTSTISKIINIVEEAANSKAPISRLADKVSSIFVPTVIGISLISFIIWMIFTKDLSKSLTTMISVLVISCPCALGLATPLAIMISTGKAAKSNILFKDAESLENLHNIKGICFDKTGTITKGKLSVCNLISYKDEKDLFKIAYSLEKNTVHPLAISICEYYKSNYNNEFFEVSNFNSVLGKGVEGYINGKKYILGNEKFIVENGLSSKLIKDDLDKNNFSTNLMLCDEKEILCMICLTDEIKETSKDAIKELKDMGINTVMITGDNENTAKYVSNEVSIDKYYSEVLPEEKGNIVLKEKEKNTLVGFVGDGINDAIALTNASIGIAIGAGSDVAISQASVILMKNDLKDVVKAIEISKDAIKNIKVSLFWAFFYNALCIPIACGVLYPFFHIQLNPMIGALAMSLSSISVVLNALRLNYKK